MFRIIISDLSDLYYMLNNSLHFKNILIVINCSAEEYSSYQIIRNNILLHYPDRKIHICSIFSCEFGQIC